MNSQQFFCLRVLVFSLLSTRCLALPSGAPAKSCASMMPRHDVAAQPADTNPYSIRVNSGGYYKPGQKVLLTILTSVNSNLIRGLLVQARQVGNYSDAIGSFQNLPSSTKFLECNSNPKGAVTHSTVLNVSTITLEWMPPEDISSMSNISFYATVAKTKPVFWEKFPSSQLMRDPSCPKGQAKCGANTVPVFKVVALLVAMVAGWFNIMGN